MNDSFPELVAAIYDASIDPVKWPTAMDQSEHLIGAFTSHILLCRAGRAEVFATAPSHTDRSFAESYERHYSKVDPMPGFVMSCPTGHFVTDEDALPKRKFLNSEFYTDWVKPQGMYTCLYVNAFRHQDCAAYLCLTRERGAKPFPRAAMAHARRLLPHLGRAAEIHFRLAEAACQFELMSHALSLNAPEIISVDVQGRIAFASPSAEDRLRNADGLSENFTGLNASTDSETRRLRRLIALGFSPRQGTGHSCTLELQRTNGKPALSVTIIPAAAMRPDRDGAHAHVALLVTDPDIRTPSCTRFLQERYHLTAAEIRVTEMILAGHELKAVAQRLRVSLGTVRNQLKCIFHKTDTHRQSALVSLILRGLSLK
ncbi:MAG: helix-turn-helix transcriptional regulator [Steroidobacteraceae bacterium]